MASDAPNGTLPRQRAVLFIVFLGIVSLFGDMTYEGARSITGPYLGVLGVTATTIGIVAGFGELLGYGARLVSGYLGDRTGKYWAVTIAGYLLNLFAVPLLALAGAWQIAVVLIVAERMGRGIRSPARDAMLSHAASRTGLGWGFGLHQALDQLGAVAGPLVVSGVLFVGSGYQAAFGWLLIPAVLSMAVLLAARYLFPRPHDFELAPPPLEGEGLAPIFWIYIVAVAFIAAGYADFSLIAYHFDKAQIMPGTWIPIVYAVAMAVDGLSALALGSLFDRIGSWTMVLATTVSAAAAPLVFLGNFPLAVTGMACWGVGTGAQDSVMRATISRLSPRQRRATAFGIMNAVYGVAWFAGSVLLGVLYDLSLAAVVLTSSLLQAAALPIFVRLAVREA
ncbi:MAG TPA: MFS transporter [Steroidobacteraceae bacterium]|nr:MFS transporter [Steroidobacteraceae bacterium]